MRRPPRGRPAKPAGPRAPDTAAFVNPWDHGCLIRYLAWLRQAYGFLPLPTPADGGVAPGVPLLDLYVQPRLRPAGKPGADPKELLAVLAEQRQVAVLGEPGAGRSTLLGWVAHALTDPGRNGVIDGIGRMVPIVFPLRVMPLDDRTRTLDALMAALRRLPFWYPGMDEVLPALLSRGQVLFILDDLDLLTGPGLLEAVYEAALDGMFQHSSCVWLLASTQDRWQDRPLRVEGMAERDIPAPLEGLKSGSTGLRVPAWELQAFDDQQVAAYAHRWVALSGVPDDERVLRADALARSIRSDGPARRLAERPGMLALLGLVDTVAGGLPTERSALIDWLVAAWIAVLDETPGAEAVPAEARRAWVEALARAAEAARVKVFKQSEAWGHGSRPNAATPVVPFGDAVELLESAVRDSGFGTLDQEAALRFVGGASVRPGVLVARAGGLAFARADHQRFLAAVHLAGDLHEKTQGDADEALQTLKGWSRTAAAREDLLDVFEVLAERPGLAEKVYKQVLGRRKDRTLGELDDLGPLALALRDGDAGVPARVQGAAGRLVHEAVHRWARERERVPVWTPDLSPVAELTELGSLDLSGCTRVTDLGPLSGLRKLTRLDLQGCKGVADLAPLANLQALQWADVRGLERIDDVGPLSAIAGLRWLDLGGCTALRDLSPLTRLTQLQALVLHGCTSVEDLAPLTALRSLRSLVISGCTGIFDLAPLRMLPRGGRVWVRGSGVRIVPPDLEWEVIGL
ncbi:MAG: NACHT domain-containing protein [Myxococcota bacterium]|nr:NACHT domain-containing protein [Myxococcota bacterium]